MYSNLSKKEKLIFLSGLFDGEGSFGIWSLGKNKKRILFVQVETTDIDMVQRFPDFFKTGFIITRPKRKDHWRDTHMWRVKGPMAWRVLKLMIPYLCQRRQDKYKTLFEEPKFGFGEWGATTVNEQTCYQHFKS